nr:NADH dehydrogenase subunit 3 [Bannacoris arboreus]WEM32393.1 NADH dehydrogenase subunit 3 [Bannacoris arboreus]
MYMIAISLILTSMLPIIMMMLCLTISMKTILDHEKMSPFECGFTPFSSPRMPFSIQFFLMCVLFLIFDIEIAIILPIILTLMIGINYTLLMTVMTFLLILIFGLYYEWINGILEWA